MKQTYIVYMIVVFAIVTAFGLPSVTDMVYQNRDIVVQQNNKNTLAKTAGTTETVKSISKVADSASKVELAIATPEVKEVPKEEPKVEEVKEEPKVVETPTLNTSKPYDEMTTEEMIAAIANGSYKLEYSKAYDASANRLTKSKGAIYYNNHKETYYSERVLPGNSLNIPGRHTAEDGTVRDGDGYICVAASTSYLARGTVVKTSMGPAKVYDSGCAVGTIDIYVNW